MTKEVSAILGILDFVAKFDLDLSVVVQLLMDTEDDDQACDYVPR